MDRTGQPQEGTEPARGRRQTAPVVRTNPEGSTVPDPSVRNLSTGVSPDYQPSHSNQTFVNRASDHLRRSCFSFGSCRMVGTHRHMVNWIRQARVFCRDLTIIRARREFFSPSCPVLSRADVGRRIIRPSITQHAAPFEKSFQRQIADTLLWHGLRPCHGLDRRSPTAPENGRPPVAPSVAVGDRDTTRAGEPRPWSCTLHLLPS